MEVVRTTAITQMEVTHDPVMMATDLMVTDRIVKVGTFVIATTETELTTVLISIIIIIIFFFFEHNRTPSGKKTVTGVQVVTASQVQSIGYMAGH